MTKIDTAGLVPMFFYGTLRPNPGPSWGMTGDEPVIKDAYIDGKLWFVSLDGSYPVAKLDRSGRVQGDIVFYEPSSPMYQRVCDVESGAGYEMREVDATYIEGDEDIDDFIEGGRFPSMKVNAWHYLRSVEALRPVPGNNWLRAVNGERRALR